MLSHCLQPATRPSVTKMQQSHSGKLIIALGIIMSTICAAVDEELFELSCYKSLSCAQFDRPGVYTMCVESICHCRNATDDAPLKCIPRDDKVKNIIAGPCPCTQPFTKCHEARDACYCIMGYRPSLDKRRCIPQTVPLHKDCEEHEQCQGSDTFGFCRGTTPRCNCKSGFIEVGGVCKPSLQTLCLKEGDCEHEHGENAVCARDLDVCYCKIGYPADSHLEKKCGPVAHYGEACTDDAQCQMTLGLGGRCQQNKCDCNMYHYTYTIDADVEPPKMGCGRKTVRGQYCRADEDCHELNRHEMDQLWDCLRGECECLLGPKAFRNGECTNSTNVANWIKLDSRLLLWSLVMAMLQLK